MSKCSISVFHLRISKYFAGPLTSFYTSVNNDADNRICFLKICAIHFGPLYLRVSSIILKKKLII
jgi:hypothetical protein